MTPGQVGLSQTATISSFVLHAELQPDGGERAEVGAGAALGYRSRRPGAMQVRAAMMSVVRSTSAERAALVGRLRAAGCVFAEDEAALLTEEAGTPDELDAMTARRVGGEPLEYIVGWAEFCGRRIAVEPPLFVPRRRTEFLVEEAARVLRRTSPSTAPSSMFIVDMCCGTGAIGAALTLQLTTARPMSIELYAVDIEPVAVRCARRNLATLKGETVDGITVDVHALGGDLFDALPAALKGKVDVLVANAPYVPTAAIANMPPEARLHEAAVALDGGSDGLDIQRRIAAGCAEWLGPGGHLLIETSRQQAPGSAGIFERAGLVVKIVRSRKFDATVIVATKTWRAGCREADDRVGAAPLGPR